MSWGKQIYSVEGTFIYPVYCLPRHGDLITFDLDIYPENPVFMQVRNDLQTHKKKNDPALFHARSLFTMSGLMLLPCKQNKFDCPTTFMSTSYQSFSAACAAARRAMGTRNGEQET